MSNLIIFDLDGVITSEEAYWDAAGLTLHELLYSPRYWNLDKSSLAGDGLYQPAASAEESRRISRAVFPEVEILALKARAINSNWDTCYATVCLHLIDVLAWLPNLRALIPLQPWSAEWMAAFRKQIARVEEQEERGRGQAGHPQGVSLQNQNVGTPLVGALLGGLAAFFASAIGRNAVGFALINLFDAYASEVLGCPIAGVFSRYSPFWAFCQDIFQEWYLGDELYTRTYGHVPAQTGKPGCIHFEQPLLPLEQVRSTLETLCQQGYVPGIATGRPGQEAVAPLKMYQLLPYFAEQHIATSDDVERAEAELRARGDQTLLNKPHPFLFSIAVERNNPSIDLQKKVTRPGNFVVVGDSTGDMLGGRAAGALTVAVLTGARTAEARRLLAQSDPDFTIDDVTKLPALLLEIDSLATIQRLQFSEREKAERLLQRWFARHMHLQTDSVTLTPRPVSLNSFNGIYRAGGKEYFFKTHVEEQGILAEYYHAELLYQAGYNIVRPLRTLHEQGQQMVIYPVVRWPIMFDLVRAVETGAAEDSAETLITAEQQECGRLLHIYQSTLALSTAEEHARAPIHQLFWHRLTGGRLKSFYADKLVPFPGRDSQDAQSALPFDELLEYHWVINGIVQQYTLGQLIEQAKTVLNPARAAMTVIGHGDAHYGNVFLENNGNPVWGTGNPASYLYFDPAFAGRHTPLLDIIKPLFHNIFATWMYFPQVIARELELSVVVRNTTLLIEHNYTLTPLRQAILQTKIEFLLTPLIAELRAQHALPDDWLEIMQLALMCCPLLTINLLDKQPMHAAIGWLGFSQAVQMGNSGIKPWRSRV